jgi:hypothetical protein
VERDLLVVYSDHSDSVSKTHSLPLLDRSLREVGIRRPEPSVIDRDGPVPHDDTAERDGSIASGANQGP